MKRFHLLPVLLLSSFWVLSGQTAQLNPTENRMVQVIDAENSKGVELLRQLVDINSGTNQSGGNQQHSGFALLVHGKTVGECKAKVN